MVSPKSKLPSTSEQPSTVVRPISQFERHCCPGASRPVAVDDDLSSGSRSSCPRYFPPYKHVHRTIFLNSAIGGKRVGQYQSALQWQAPQHGLSFPSGCVQTWRVLHPCILQSRLRNSRLAALISLFLTARFSTSTRSHLPTCSR